MLSMERLATLWTPPRGDIYFSIPTSVVHSEQKKKMARLLPLESLMLETDSPVLAPVRGEINEPANLIRSAEAISAIKRIPLEEVIAVTTANASSLFQYLTHRINGAKQKSQ